MNILEQETIDIPCENCRRKNKKTIGWIKRNKQFACICGTVISLDTDQFRREIAKVERSLADLDRMLKNFGK